MTRTTITLPEDMSVGDRITVTATEPTSVDNCVGIVHLEPGESASFVVESDGKVPAWLWWERLP